MTMVSLQYQRKRKCFFY